MPDSSVPQSFANHTRFDPAFHGALLPLFLINVIVVIVKAVRDPGLWNFWLVAMALGALLAILKIRQYAAKVQDRVIRLEETLRLAALAPSLPAKELTESQFVALRFASNEEVAALARRAMDEKLSNKDIKKSIQNWRADLFRV